MCKNFSAVLTWVNKSLECISPSRLPPFAEQLFHFLCSQRDLLICPQVHSWLSCLLSMLQMVTLCCIVCTKWQGTSLLLLTSAQVTQFSSRSFYSFDYLVFSEVMTLAMVLRLFIHKLKLVIVSVAIYNMTTVYTENLKCS